MTLKPSFEISYPEHEKRPHEIADLVEDLQIAFNERVQAGCNPFSLHDYYVAQELRNVDPGILSSYISNKGLAFTIYPELSVNSRYAYIDMSIRSFIQQAIVTGNYPQLRLLFYYQPVELPKGSRYAFDFEDSYGACALGLQDLVRAFSSCNDLVIEFVSSELNSRTNPAFGSKGEIVAVADWISLSTSDDEITKISISNQLIAFAYRSGSRMAIQECSDRLPSIIGPKRYRSLVQAVKGDPTIDSFLSSGISVLDIEESGDFSMNHVMSSFLTEGRIEDCHRLLDSYPIANENSAEDVLRAIGESSTQPYKARSLVYRIADQCQCTLGGLADSIAAIDDSYLFQEALDELEPCLQGDESEAFSVIARATPRNFRIALDRDLASRGLRSPLAFDYHQSLAIAIRVEDWMATALSYSRALYRSA